MTIKSEWLNEETGEIFTDTRELKDDSVKKPYTRKSSSKKKDRSNRKQIKSLHQNL